MMDALTIFVAISKTIPWSGRIRVQTYKAIVIGIYPKGFLRDSKILSSSVDSVFSDSFVKKLITIFITKPLNKSATMIVNIDEIIGPRLMPKRPAF